ncbi:MAG: NusG domain II-containing protein [Clostridia bacterium]|nr:NusG domain II-containing protein [Clostridia bacterium]
MFFKLKAGDIAVAALIIAIAAANLAIFMHSSEGSATALIIKNGKVVQKLKLDDINKRIEIEYKDKHNILIAAEHGRIRFEKSDCPDQVCVRTGWLSRPGQTAACVPGGIIIKIQGEDSDTDIILK